jgi:hypothetical protein
MMYPPLNQMLMCRIVRIEHLHRLPPALPLPRIIRLERETRQQHRHRQPLRIHTRLHELLLACEVRVPSNNTERDTHGRNPLPEDERVAVGLAPVFHTLGGGFLGFDLLREGLGFIVVVLARVFSFFKGAGGAVGVDDCYTDTTSAFCSSGIGA